MSDQGSQNDSSVPQPLIHAQFTIKSGYICYGGLDDILYGASSEPTQGLPSAPPEPSGTVITHKHTFNTAALNGTWNTYQLVGTTNQEVSAWFACHSSVDPQTEIDKILQVSGSPYERDHGSTFNSPKTAAEGVLVINRYDWERRDDQILSETAVTELRSTGIGLTDLENAEAQVEEWKRQSAGERDQSKEGAWFYIPDLGYRFARWGFNDAHTAARSFLFFTTNTYFTHTAFRGISISLRPEETSDEYFNRKLREGCKFESFETVAMMFNSRLLSEPEPLPAESECIGPFDSNGYLFKDSDWVALREYAEIREHSEVRGFAEELKEDIYALLENLALTYLLRFVEPIKSFNSIHEVADTLCPNHAAELLANCFLYRTLAEPTEKTIPGFDTSSVESCIKTFLSLRCGEAALVENSEFIAGVCRYLTYFLTELLELTGRTAIGNSHRVIVPGDVRIAVCNNREFLPHLKMCKMMWYKTG